jgi:hypothetical protein
MHLIYQGGGGPLDLHVFSSFVSWAIIVGAALGYLSLFVTFVLFLELRGRQRRTESRLP